MKALPAFFLLISAATAAAGESPAATPPPPPATTVVTGKVAEVRNVETYTYLRLRTKDGETWAAVLKAPVKRGADVTIEKAMLMHDFESKALKRTFRTIYFGKLAATGSGTPTGADPRNATTQAASAKPVDTRDFPVAKASGPNSRTVVDIITKATELNDKPVLVRGKVVKFSREIMNRNWLHLRDGSGLAADNTDTLIVSTLGEAKPGEIVTVKGIVRTHKDFGSGYFYKVLIEEASLQR